MMELAMRTMWLGTLAGLVGLGLFTFSGMAQSQKQDEGGQSLKQMKLTEKQIQSFISAQKQLAPLSSKLDAAGDKPDPALQSELEKIAKNNGFSTLDELGDVGANISIVLAGLDPKTGKFTEPPDLIKKDIEEIKQNKEMSQKDRDEALSEMQQALKTAAPLQFKENVALVKKYQKELDQVLGQDQENQEGAAKKQEGPAKKQEGPAKR
jgi:hypothetical protein